MKDMINKLWNLGPVTKLSVSLVYVSVACVVMILGADFVSVVGVVPRGSVSDLILWLFAIFLIAIFSSRILKGVAERMGEVEEKTS